MACKLKSLKIDSVDLVDRGANQDAYITLFKRNNSQDEPEKTAMENVNKEQQPETVGESETGLFKRFIHWFGQILKSTETQENDKEVIDTMKIDKSKMILSERFLEFFGKIKTTEFQQRRPFFVASNRRREEAARFRVLRAT